MLLYQAEANVIVGAIALLSLGAIVLPELPIRYLLITADSVRDGWADLDRLKEGHAVPIIPGDYSYFSRAWYHDYLRLFLLMQDEDVIAERIYRVIAGNLGRVWITRVSAECSYKDHHVVLEGGYQNATGDAFVADASTSP